MGRLVLQLIQVHLPLWICVFRNNASRASAGRDCGEGGGTEVASVREELIPSIRGAALLGESLEVVGWQVCGPGVG